MSYDVGIIGLGAMGSAAAWTLVCRGASVIGWDQYALGHDRGSSHGSTRIIRRIYSEGFLYDELVREAYAGWARIEHEHGQAFFTRTGGLDVSVTANGILEDALAAALASGQPFEVLEGLELEQRFPALELGGRGRAVFNADAGILDSDKASGWMRADAVERGATLLDQSPITGWTRTANGFRVAAGGTSTEVRKLIVAAGAWCGELIPALKPALVPERQVIAWFQAGTPEFDSLPIFQLETDERERYYFLPPHKGEGLKVGLYNHRRERGYDHITPRGVDPTDLDLLQKGVSLCLPSAGRDPLANAECRFTNAPGDRFVMGAMPGDNDLIILSPCSGHGYKFVPAIGEIAADLALEEEPEVDLTDFSVERVV